MKRKPDDCYLVDIVDDVATNSGVDIDDARKVIAELGVTIRDCLCIGAKVVIPNLGEFATVRVNGQETLRFGKERIRLPPRLAVRFLPDDDLRAAVKESGK